jgi:chromosome segregation ATPase
MSDSSGMDADSDRRLTELRRERFFVRSQLKVLRRTRERQAAAGAATAASDERLSALQDELSGLDAEVEGLRARLGRPHRTPPDV